ncbi:MAG TPA: LamG-like jellyroll fold domain-containing protein, partial [Xanthomonadales bacterium]|nr:LamG-like jellyroll fold domain-containing protein [Xanthomonadales bacterium]
GKDGGGGEMPVSSSCTAPCVGDAGADFDSTPMGKNGRWRYLEDRRNRTWTPMTPDAQGVMLGADTNNAITACKATSTESACTALPGALLVSAAGAAAAADPAIELTAPMNQHVRISLKVHVPVSAPAQTVRLYRNSREDVLFSGDAQPGMILETSISIDALASDRILFALAPSGAAVQYVGVQLFVSGTGMAFPQACQIALSFAAASGNTVDNLCGGDFTSTDYNAGAVPPTLAAGPFPEQGMAADIVPDRYYEGTNLVNRGGDTTLQFWMKHDGPTASAPWPYSDLDLDNVNPGGLGVVLIENNTKLEVNTCTSGNPLAFRGDSTPYPTDGAWHFVRIVHRGGNVEVCLDGARKFTFAAPTGTLATKYKPHLGRNVVWTPSGAFYDGGIDDVRVFGAALPCD